jgi:SAM-dependent methyltransferase
MTEGVGENAERLSRERAFHDARYSDDSARTTTGRFYDLVIDARAEFAAVLNGVGPGEVALEYGSGTGGLGRTLASRGVRVHGIDISPEAVRHANESARAAGLNDVQLSYTVMDAEHLTFPDATFDLVFGSGILHHLNLDAAFAEISRVLSPGGVAVFFEPMGHNPAINVYRRLTPQMRTVDEHPLLMADLNGAERWFDRVEPSFHALTVFAALPLRRTQLFEWAVESASALDRAVMRRIRPLRRFSWIVVLRLRKVPV